MSVQRRLPPGSLGAPAPDPQPRPAPGSALRRMVAPGIVLGVLILIPAILDPHALGLMSRYLLFGIAALGLDLLWGKAGLLSFGHAAMFGLGAYSSGLVLRNLDGGAAPIAIIVGVAVPMLFGLLTGLVLFYGRVKGVYFGVVTLLVAVLLEQLAGIWTDLTGGFNGLTVPTGLTFGTASVQQPREMYYVILVAAVGSWAIVRWLIRTPLGLAVEASRMNDRRAETLGYDVPLLRTGALTGAAAIGGLAGALYGPLEGFVYPAQLGLAFSTSLIVWVAIGGRGTLVGAFLGAIAVNMTQSQLASTPVQQYWPLLTSIILLVVILFQPRGLVGVFRLVGRTTDA